MNSLKLSDLNFSIILMLEFPFACNHETETMLSDFLEENYEMPNEKWLEALCGKSDYNGNDIEPWNGLSLEVKINEQVALNVEFHNTETTYFLNNTFIGNSGGHFTLSLFEWSEFLKIIEGRKNFDILFFLLLPFVLATKKEYDIINKKINESIKNLAFKEKDYKIISSYLTEHCIAEETNEELFYIDNKLGKICSKNHSERNIKNNKENILAINKIIELAKN